MPRPKSVHDEQHGRHVETGANNEEADMPKIHNKHGSMVKAFHDYGITVNKVHRNQKFKMLLK